MGTALRATIPPRRSAAILGVVTVVIATSMSWGIALASAASTPSAARPHPRPAASRAPGTASRPRVLLVGDSVLDQQGSAASFLLRQAGVDAKAVGLWGSGLLTVDQYDNGRTRRAGMWFQKARGLISSFDPDVVGVYLNHNYWPPFPHDAAGHEISDLWSPAGQRMIAQQVRAFITILRARNARVFFIAPIPAGSTTNPDPAAWSAIWHGYLPLLQAMNVPVVDSAPPLENAAGLRAETEPSCNGAEARVRPVGDLHLTRFGAGRAASVLASYVATLVHADLRGNAAPGEATTALVPTASGRGYWLVGCDGSVYAFGDATRFGGARTSMQQHGGVVAAVGAPSGTGMWMVARDGFIAAIGNAAPLAFTTPPTAPIVSATGAPHLNGLWATTETGTVLRAGAAGLLGDLSGAPPGAPVVGIAATHAGHGYWLVDRNGNVSAFGDAVVVAGTASSENAAAVVGIAPTADDLGYWLVRSHGSVLALGDARFLGTARWKPRPYPYSALLAHPGATVGIVSMASGAQGYWIVGTTGRVVGRGAAAGHGGDNNLALFTQ